MTENLTIRLATPQDIPSLAVIQWHARKAGVLGGYLPEIELLFPPGTDITQISDEVGTRNAATHLQELFNQMPQDNHAFMMIAEVDGKGVGKLGAKIKEEKKAIHLFGLDILPEFQNQGIATRLKREVVGKMEKEVPDTEMIIIERYNMSDEFTRKNFRYESMFNKIRRYSIGIEEDKSRGELLKWFHVPISDYKKIING